MDGCLKMIICLTNPLGWIYLIWEGIENAGRQAQIQKQNAYFDSLNPKTMEDLYKIDSMNGHDFEYYVARILKHNGYSDVEVTSGSNDFGVDVLASKGSDRYAIQVKRQQSTVSRRAVSDAVAGAAHYSCNRSMVITNSRMSKSGQQFADSTHCIVIQREELIELIERAHS